MAEDPRLTGKRRTGPDRKKTPEQELEVVRDYRSGMKLREIEAKHAIGKWTVYAILRRHGIEPESRRGRPLSLGMPGHASREAGGDAPSHMGADAGCAEDFPQLVAVSPLGTRRLVARSPSYFVIEDRELDALGAERWVVARTDFGDLGAAMILFQEVQRLRGVLERIAEVTR